MYCISFFFVHVCLIRVRSRLDFIFRFFLSTCSLVHHHHPSSNDHQHHCNCIVNVSFSLRCRCSCVVCATVDFLISFYLHLWCKRAPKRITIAFFIAENLPNHSNTTKLLSNTNSLLWFELSSFLHFDRNHFLAHADNSPFLSERTFSQLKWWLRVCVSAYWLACLTHLVRVRSQTCAHFTLQFLFFFYIRLFHIKIIFHLFIIGLALGLLCVFVRILFLSHCSFTASK